MTARMRRFFSYLKGLPVVKQEDGSSRLEFWINGSQVCKSFFKSACAIPRQSFDSAIALAQGDKTNCGTSRLCCNDNKSIRLKPPDHTMRSFTPRKMRVLLFLDVFFMSNGTKTFVETSPNTVGEFRRKCLVIRMRWSKLYENYYLPSCNAKGDVPASYAEFTAYRKKYRPHFKKHRKVQRKSFNHLECGECVRLQALVDKSRIPEEKSMFQMKLDAHLEFQAQFRFNYETQIEKVLQHNRTTDGAKDIIMYVELNTMLCCHTLLCCCTL